MNKNLLKVNNLNTTTGHTTEIELSEDVHMTSWRSYEKLLSFLITVLFTFSFKSLEDSVVTYGYKNHDCISDNRTNE